jgi:ubiquinone biosynthesis protein
MSASAPCGRLRRALTFWRDTSAPRAERLRLALEALGPIFVKFGQMLSTRRDLLPADIADELREAPGPRAAVSVGMVEATLTRLYGKAIDQVFRSFDETPIASARRLRRCISRHCPTARRSPSRCCGRGSPKVIEKDISLLHAGARSSRSCGPDGKRCDRARWSRSSRRRCATSSTCTREAANCSQLRRNFEHSPLLPRARPSTGISAGTEVMVNGANGGHPDRAR